MADTSVEGGVLDLHGKITRAETAAMLVRHLAVTGKHPDSPHLFSSPKTGTMYDSDFFRHIHDNTLKAIGAEHVRFHGLRRTLATLSLKNRVDVKTLSGALGHYSAGFTLNTYTHTTVQMKQDAASTIGAVIAKAM